jgi:uncharacterized C2H2 Zn-finger protein
MKKGYLILTSRNINTRDSKDYLYCKKCGDEYEILYFEELPIEMQINFKQILNKTPLRKEAFFFYCKRCDEFSVLNIYKS